MQSLSLVSQNLLLKPLLHGERVDIVLAGGPVLARVPCTLIDIYLAVLTTEAVNAETLRNIQINYMIIATKRMTFTLT